MLVDVVFCGGLDWIGLDLIVCGESKVGWRAGGREKQPRTNGKG